MNNGLTINPLNIGSFKSISTYAILPKITKNFKKTYHSKKYKKLNIKKNMSNFFQKFNKHNFNNFKN